MKKLLTTLFLSALTIGGSISTANALISRAWVSGKGTDVPTCGAVASPCRTFKYVHDNIISAGGEIDVLDAGDFGPLTINKSLSIVNDGASVANIQQATANANAIIIAAGATDVVHLRGLSIDGLGTGARGILFQSAASLSIVKCTTRRFALSGIMILNSSASKVTISDSASTENMHAGVYLVPQATLQASISRFTGSLNARAGINLDGQISPAAAAIFVSVVDSVASNNGVAGYAASSLAGHGAPTLALDQATSVGNVDGVVAGALAKVRIGRSTVSGNTQAGLRINGGAASSLGNNNFTDNAGGDVVGGALGSYNQL